MATNLNMENLCDFGPNCFTFTWILENFEYSEQRAGDPLLSPTFIVDPLEASKWCVSIYPRGGEAFDNFISLFLRRELDSKGPDTIDINLELAFIASDGSVLASEFLRNLEYTKKLGFGCPKFQERKSIFAEKSKFLSQGALIIRCRIWNSVGQLQMNGQCTARTRIGVERKAFLWKIPDLNTFAVGQEISFGLKSTSDDKPVMTLKLLLRDIGSSQYGFYVEFVTFDPKIAFSTFQGCLVDAENDFVDLGKHELWLSPSKNADCELGLVKDTLVYNNCLFLPNDVLTLYCEQAFSTGILFEGIEDTVYGRFGSFTTKNLITVAPKADGARPSSEISFLKSYLCSTLKDNMHNSKISESGSLSSHIIASKRKSQFLKCSEGVLEGTVNADVKKSDSETFNLQMDLFTLLKDNIYSDVKLCAESETFNAHWLILSARSPVFSAMFRSGLKETEKNQIEIKDLNPNTVRRMLLYMYTGTLEGLQWEIASDLYMAAERYELVSLKEQCSSFLKHNISRTNAIEVLLLADLHQDQPLKSIAQEYILENGKSIVNSSEWKILMEKNAQLAFETMLLKFKE